MNLHRLSPAPTPVLIRAGEATLAGDLSAWPGALGIVVLAHGGGLAANARCSPRNRYVAGVLEDAGLATLCMDLLTEEEESADRSTGEHRADAEMLAQRLIGAMRWLGARKETAGLRLGHFGSGVGAAAALIAAAAQPMTVKAVVSSGGRPDLAGARLAQVRTPSLFIVGREDAEVMSLTLKALPKLPGEKRLDVVAGAGHRLEEPGALETMATLARDWFADHLPERDYRPGI